MERYNKIPGHDIRIQGQHMDMRVKFLLSTLWLTFGGSSLQKLLYESLRMLHPGFCSGFAADNQTLHSLATGMSSYAVLESAENKRNQIIYKELHKDVTGNMYLNIYTYAYVWFSPLRPGRKHESPFLGCLWVGEVWGAKGSVTELYAKPGWESLGQSRY